MPRVPRKQSESGFYHVYSRGVGHQLIFEDDKDRAFFLNVLGDLLACCEGDLQAWVLMGNHFHLILHMSLGTLSDFMRKLQTAYAVYFNKRHDHVGHLFQGRFGSQPIESDEQLKACVRYVHLNPVKAGISKTCDYKWSSYRGYIKGAAVTKTDFILGLFGGVEQFVHFHRLEDEGRFVFIDVDQPSVTVRQKRLSDSEAKEVAKRLFGNAWQEELPALPKPERDAALKKLKDAGLSALQLERLTGLGRNIINRAK